MGLSEDLRRGRGMWTSPRAAGNRAEASERSCLLHCARGAGIYPPQLCGSSAPGDPGPAVDVAGAEAASGDGRYGESLSPARCWAPGTCCFTLRCLNLRVCETGGSIIPEQPNPRAAYFH